MGGSQRGRKSGRGAAAFGAAGEEERLGDGRGGILAKRAAHRAGERAATPATAGRTAGPRPRLRGQAFGIFSAHSEHGEQPRARAPAAGRRTESHDQAGGGGGPTGEGDNRVGCAEPAHGSPGERLQGVGTLARPVMQETPGEGTGAGAADQRASPGQPAAVHSADGHQGHRAAGSATSRGRRRRRRGPVRLFATSPTHRPALPAEHHRIRTQPGRHLRLKTGNT